MQHLPSLCKHGSARNSPVRNKQIRNPFDNLLATGAIKPVCHKSKLPMGRALSPVLLPTLSPKSPLRLSKVTSENNLRFRGSSVKRIYKSLKFIKLQDIKLGGLNEKFSNPKEITFGVLTIEPN